MFRHIVCATSVVILASACSERPRTPFEPARTMARPPATTSAIAGTQTLSRDVVAVPWACLLTVPTSSWFTASVADSTCDRASQVRVNDRRFSAGAAVVAPTNLAASVAGSTVTVTWSPPEGADQMLSPTPRQVCWSSI